MQFIIIQMQPMDVIRTGVGGSILLRRTSSPPPEAKTIQFILISSLQARSFIYLLKIIMMKKLFLFFFLIPGIYCSGQEAILWTSNTSKSWLIGSNWISMIVPTDTQIAQFGAKPTRWILQLSGLILEELSTSVP